MRYTPQQIEDYRRDGVLFLGKVLTDAQVQGARDHIAQLIAGDKVDRPSSGKGQHLIRRLDASEHDPWFRELITAEVFGDIGEAALGPDVQHFQDNVFYKPASVGAPTPWHQDNIWWHGDPPELATVWIALDPVNGDNGAVQYVRGSHSRLIDHTLPVQDPGGFSYNVIDPKAVDQSRLISFTLAPGEGVLHHCLTIHGAPANVSSLPRRGYTVHLMRTGLLRRDPVKNPVLRGRALAAPAAS